MGCNIDPGKVWPNYAVGCEVRFASGLVLLKIWERWAEAI